MAMRYPGGFISSTAPTVSANSAKGVWTLEEAMQYIRAGQWPVPTGNGDPFFQYNTMLLPGQGTNGAQNNTFLDSSTNNFTITRNGNTTQGTFTPFSGTAGNWSNYFDGNGDFLSMTGSSATNFNGVNWTIECWFYKTALSGGNENLIQSTTGTNAWVPYLALGLNNNQTIGVSLNAVGYSSTQTYSLNSWNHIAVVRNGGVVSVYLNGVATSISVTVDIPSTNLSFWIGKVDNAPGGGGYLYYFNGFLSNLRVVKGTAVYTSAFTPPTAPLTAITNTSLLTCQSNSFIDNSTNAFAITPSGNTAVTPFQPFGAPTSAYSASTIGGSGYFDGSGDYLTSGSTTAFDSFCTGSATGITLTLEAFVYPTATVAGASPWQSAPIFAKGSTYFCFGIYNNKLRFYWFDGATQYVDSTATVPLNAWSQVSATVNGSSITLYVNGTSSGTGTFTGIQTAAQGTAENFGYQPSSATIFTGYISGVRISNNVRTISLQTAPFSNDANTKYLLNFTNAGIIDNAQDNNLETVGNAQISTTQYKWGASSMYFDGTGDYLYVPASQNVAFGTGDFTWEGWIYSTGNSDKPIYESRSTSTATDGFTLTAYSSTVIRVYTNSVIVTATISDYTNKWTHVAFVRTAGVCKLFINGNECASAALTSNFSNTIAAVGAGRYGSNNLDTYFAGYIADVRLTKGYARYPYSFTAPTAAFPLFWQAAATPSSDPYFNNTTLLLPGNGTNGAQNNTFLDSSTNAFTITRNGNTTQGTFTPFSQTGWSNYFDNTGDYLSGTFSSTTVGSGDFTIEFFYYPITFENYDTLFSNTRGTTGFNIGTNASKTVVWYSNSGEQINSGTLVQNAWNHIAFTRTSNTLRLYVNGYQTGATPTVSNNFSATSYRIGDLADAGGEPCNGYISNLRVVTQSLANGSTYTVPTAPLTAIANTSLLTCQSNRFVDNSTNAFAITRNGDVSVQAFSPFNPTAAYSTSTVGGSGYFDGSGDCLTLPSSSNLGFGTSNFCVEFWFNAGGVTQPATPRIIGNNLTFGTNAWTIGISSNNLFVQIYNFTTTNPTISTSTNVINPQWNHIVLCRSGSDFGLFVNGTRVGTYSTSATLDGGGSQSFCVGGRVTSEVIGGYISDCRVVIGSSVYTPTSTTLTVPTAPLTAITNTQLLCNFTNGGIIDNTAKNNLETVGGASISTTVSKFGGSSMYFDGNDKVTLPYSQNFNLGTNYTIEGWVYPTSVTGYQRIFDIVNSATSSPAFLDIAFNGTALVSELRTTNGGAVTTISGGTVSTGAWIHVALSVYSGSARLFLNGVQVGSTTTFSALPDQNFVGIGGIGNSLTIDYLTGYINDLRVTKGIGRYTQNFTPPTTAFLTL